MVTRAWRKCDDSVSALTPAPARRARGAPIAASAPHGAPSEQAMGGAGGGKGGGGRSGGGGGGGGGFVVVVGG